MFDKNSISSMQFSPRDQTHQTKRSNGSYQANFLNLQQQKGQAHLNASLASKNSKVATASSKTKSKRKKVLQWSDYFKSKQKDSEPFEYDTREPQARQEYLSSKNNMQVNQANRLFNDQGKRFIQTYHSSVFRNKEGVTDPFIDHSLLTQKKAAAACAPP